MIDSKVKNILGDFLHKSTNMEEMLKLIYVLEAWKNMSNDIEIHDSSLSFEIFCNNPVDLDNLSSIFSLLADRHKLFIIYRFQPRIFQAREIENILTFLKNNEVPISFYSYVNEYFSKRSGHFIPSLQVSELGIKLLGPIEQEVYVPFTNSFSYVHYTDKIIFSESKILENEFWAEVINILGKGNLVHHSTDPLRHPSFSEGNNSDTLIQYENVLSFPPFGLKDKINPHDDKFHRFNFFRGSNLDIAHMEHIFSQTKSKAVILMPVGFTFRGSMEERCREYLVTNNFIETIIQLPPNLHSATSIETTFFIINKNKDDEKVLFINLKDESFIRKDGRKLVFKSLDDILDIYKNKKEIEGITSIVSNQDISCNNYSLAIDRYVLSKEAKELQKVLANFESEKLEEIAEIKRSQLFKDEEIGLEIHELSPSNFSKAGYTLECGKSKKIGSQEKKLNTYELKPFDILLSTKGTIGKVAIIGQITKPMIASQAIQVIRLKNGDQKDRAIALYMYFKSDLGQTVLSSLVAGAAMPQIATAEIKKLQIPLFTKDNEKELFLNFNNEIEMYNKITLLETNIQQIHNKFLGNN